MRKLLHLSVLLILICSGPIHSLAKLADQPYKTESANFIYELLFCDDVDLWRRSGKATGYPYDELLAEKPDTAKLLALLDDKSLEGRQKMLACNVLRASGVKISKRVLYGIIIEVALPEGLEVVAVFSDGSMRYINYTGKMAFWESHTSESEDLKTSIFTAATKVVDATGPWKKARRPCPATGDCRISFLVSDGLYFGEGDIDVMQSDPLSAPVLKAGMEILQFITSNSRAIHR